MCNGFATRLLLCAGCLFVLSFVRAAQVDIHGPSGSVSFGASVTVLPNGNFVVTDPNGPISGLGAVYLYSPDGNLISTLTGAIADDHVGREGVTVVGGNFVVGSSSWHDGSVANAGAVTWVNGTTGLSGVVSPANSLVGTHANDYLGSFVFVLSNGNYVVADGNWNGNVGSVTWCNGSGGTVGAVTVSNSLTGGVVYGWVTPLTDGNYVVTSPNWSNPTSATAQVGAVTWLSGSGTYSGVVSAANSLIGTTANDQIGSLGVVALNNGQYVVASPSWHNGIGAEVGAATWRAGGATSPDIVSTGNSLFGTTPADGVGSNGAIALSNGNYVVLSPLWNQSAGAATWGNGATGTFGAVSAANSLIGSTSNDEVGYSGVALANGNYVVGAPQWNNGSGQVGAAILIDGSGQYTGNPISPGNALVGTATGDWVGADISALGNGNYLVQSSSWNGGTGAATWGNGTTGITGPVLPTDSLSGSGPQDYLGYPHALSFSDGNYVVFDDLWNNGVTNGHFGAVTWCRAGGGTTGAISTARAFVGTTQGDQVGQSLFRRAFDDGNYAFVSPDYSNGKGAVTLASGNFRLKGTVAAWNSVISSTNGNQMTFDYDATRHRLIVGRPAENLVSLFTMDQIFAEDFDP
jgi:Repeat of unknown function (DUF5650)